MSDPLSELELDPMEVDKLFKAETMSLSDEAMDLIVEAERRNRENFKKDEKAGRRAGSSKSKSKPKVTLSEAEIKGMTLDDLGIKDIEL